MSEADPRCPECGEPIGQTATYCMHCSADLTDELQRADADGDWSWDESNDGSSRETATDPSTPDGPTEGQILDPDGLVDNTLTVVVGILGGIVVGFVGTVVLGAVTGSGWALLFGAVVWLGATAYLVRRRTVQGAISKGGYAVALVLLSVPIIALSPVLEVDGGLEERGGLFVVLLVFVVIPAVIAAVIGWAAGQYVPAESGSSEG